MKSSDITNTAFKQFICSITGAVLLIILVSTIQPGNGFAQKYNDVSLDTSNYKVTFIELGSLCSSNKCNT